MENYENGIITEEALEEVAGGLNIDKGIFKKVLIGAGVGVATLASLAVGFGAGILAENKGKFTDKIKNIGKKKGGAGTGTGTGTGTGGK